MIMTLPRHMKVLLGLFSGSSLSASWIAVHTHDFVGAVAVGTVTCAIILILLRFEDVTTQMSRRRTDRRQDRISI